MQIPITKGCFFGRVSSLSATSFHGKSQSRLVSCCFFCFSLVFVLWKDSTLVASSLAAQRGETRRSVGVQCSITCDPFKVHDKKNSRRLLSVRSDLSGAAATPESTTYPEPGTTSFSALGCIITTTSCSSFVSITQFLFLFCL